MYQPLCKSSSLFQISTWCICVDYRALNKLTVPDKYPIPNINELFDELNVVHIFSKIDLWFGYHQIRVNPKNIPRIAFRTHSSRYEFVVTPFGLTNALSTFQATMDDIFRSHLSLLEAHQFYVKSSKCSFSKLQINFLGYVITKNGVQVENEKISVVQSWSTPSNVKKLRGFLGLNG